MRCCSAVGRGDDDNRFIDELEEKHEESEAELDRLRESHAADLAVSHADTEAARAALRAAEQRAAQLAARVGELEVSARGRPGAFRGDRGGW